jgi:hypothetical protein
MDVKMIKIEGIMTNEEMISVYVLQIEFVVNPKLIMSEITCYVVFLMQHIN